MQAITEEYKIHTHAPAPHTLASNLTDISTTYASK